MVAQEEIFDSPVQDNDGVHRGHAAGGVGSRGEGGEVSWGPNRPKTSVWPFFGLAPVVYQESTELLFGLPGHPVGLFLERKPAIRRHARAHRMEHPKRDPGGGDRAEWARKGGGEGTRKAQRKRGRRMGRRRWCPARGAAAELAGGHCSTRSGCVMRKPPRDSPVPLQHAAKTRPTVLCHCNRQTHQKAKNERMMSRAGS